jgi:NitT/TauT family transport system permease protein
MTAEASSATVAEPVDGLVPAPGAGSARPAGRVGGRRSALRHWVIRLASLAAALGLWQVLAATHTRLWLHFDQLPTVPEVARDFWYQLGTSTYYHDIGVSLERVLAGFLLAAVVGTAVGIVIARSPTSGDVLQPLVEIIRPIPAIAMVPIAILLFPSNQQGIIFITFMAAFFPIVVSVRHAVRGLPVIWEDVLRTMGASRWKILLRMVLPGALPGVFTGLSVGIGVSWICVISAEMISGQFGVGYRTWLAYTVIDYPGVIVGMITIGLLGWGSSALIELAGRRVVRWLPRDQRSGR